MHVAQKFKYLLDTYRRPDGHRWTGQQLDKATGRVVTRSYVTNLRKGRIDNPGFERIRIGAISDPTVSQVAALASVFGVEPSYLLDRGEPSLLDEELVQALRDEDVRDITRESSRLPDGERRLVLGIVWQFRDQNVGPST